ncbi:MAG TPA: PSD1 and planctomycete cytochrome C domain-containing protein [Bryobacteraceae bacterium]|nr:PSD1 and planctomycete cytochrome C domain-containing protein [Bryobacteraceae bacterium]
MRRFCSLACLLAPLLCAESPDSREFFENRIRPVFARTCFPCHSSTRMGNLDMSSREALLKGGNIGSAIVPGKPEESLLIQAVNHSHDRLKMPLGQPKLSDRQIEDLQDWIKAGAAWPESPVAAKGKPFVITPEQRNFWAFQPVRKRTPPATRNKGWAKSPIDQFLLAAMEGKGVTPGRPASRRTLIRRAYYDLIGLPPTATGIDAFVNDRSPAAFANLVDRLLQSPQYGERWGRYWLDIARYSDDRLESEVDAPYANAFRYRDWVIQAFNSDMPYNQFLKAQVAGDQLGDNAKYAAGLGFYALRPDTQDDRVDVTGRAFLGLTTGCAQCHNHKFDPIPATDYYALLGIFTSSEDSQLPLAPEAVVKDWQDREKKVLEKQAEIRDFLHSQATLLAGMFAHETARYSRAARRVVVQHEGVVAVASAERLDPETLQRWIKYLANPQKDHAFLKGWRDASFDDEKFQEVVLGVLKERKTVDDENAVRKALAKSKGNKASTDLVSLKTESFYLWRDLFFNDFYGNRFKQEDDGILYYGPNRGFYETDGTVERFLQGEFKAYLNRAREELSALKANLPPQYPFLHTIKDSAKLRVERVRVGGSDDNPGEEVPRRFLTVLSDGAPFVKGSGRLELAEAVASATNPLTARVMVNRIWAYHFGQGIVATPSDFGFMGARPTHPELLDYLAAKFVENGWSLKALHREIMLTAAYQLDSQTVSGNEEVDPGNRLLWRANTRRLDAEALRDSLLKVSGELDLEAGGPPVQVSSSSNRRRTVYAFVSRRKLDGTLALFDFPNPNLTSEKRSVTITPPQQLFLLNGEFAMDRAQRLAANSKSDSAAETIQKLYRSVFGRAPSAQEIRLASTFVDGNSERWALYAQALLNSNEFLFIP